ncbi:NADPH2:quinone reductase [Solimonas aquatica]|uniref:NADPH2:quinone reductase n=1 Tax=Solimonas aquatica TaxID=489703 RepID=A0A1H9M4S2_9GAMM|nr:NADPH:quinone oxidoreductase family protein [Solimonas aquatica]SER18674.1 NADPH2:quinone reductase [Solimonas aquatica]
MKAVICKQLGGPELLRLEEVPDPKPGAREVRIAVAGAGVNFPDVLIIQGKYQLRAEPPFIPGAEVAGRVLEVGSEVKRLKVGDSVAALVNVGGFAEQVCAADSNCLPVPAGIDLVALGAFPLVYGTTYHALKQRGQLKAGETLLVLGASGGVGLSAVQLGKRMGARVIAAASSAEKLALCQAQGADALIDYSKESLKDAVKQLTQGQGADVIYDPVGGALGEECLSCIAWNGRYLVIGFASGPIPNLAANRLLLKGASAVGVFWGAFTQREPKLNAENFAQLFAWLADGSLKPYLSKRYALHEAPQALQDMMARKVSGKVVIAP